MFLGMQDFGYAQI